MSNPSIIHRPLGVIHRFDTLPSKRNMSIQGLEPALISTYHPLDCLPYSSDIRQVNDQNRPIIDRSTITFQLLVAITAQVTAQVEGRVNLLMQKSLQELADALGMIAAQVTAQVAGEATAPVELPTQSPTQSSDPVEGLLIILQKGEQSAGELRKAANITHRHTFRTNYLHPALKQGLIENTIPDRPTSRLQKYRLTDKGRAWLAGRKG